MEGRVNSAITALQFQDMVSQLIGHVRRRVDALGKVVNHFGVLGEALRVDAADANSHDAIEQLRRETDKLAEGLRNLAPDTSNNPVGQKAMTQGDIELF